MLLRYQNLTIRDAVVQDAGQLAQWWNDGRVMAHAGFPNGTGETVQEIAETIKNCDTSHRLLMIEMDDIAIGEMSVRWKADATAAIGIKLCDASRQNKGIGKVLLSMLISSLFHEQGCHRIILYVNLTNTRAQHVYEQLGFTLQLYLNRFCTHTLLLYKKPDISSRYFFYFLLPLRYRS